MDIVAVDWSGAAVGAAGHIWSAHVAQGALVDLHNGRSRDEVIDDLIALRAQSPGGLVVGLDFSFSFPAWFLRARAFATVDDLWRAAAQEGEEWLTAGVPPFWGRPGCRRPALPAHLRRAERVITVGGIKPKSVFQVGGAGAVGTGSVRGMPHLLRLRAAGFSIWPFDPASPWTVMEIYPRLLTGPVHKRSRADRVRYLESVRWSVPETFGPSLAGSEDAFDAGISALVLYDHLSDLAALRQTCDPVTLLEGDVWRPPKIHA